MKKVVNCVLILLLSVTVIWAEEKGYMENLTNEDETIAVSAIDEAGKKEDKKSLPKLLELLSSDSRIKVRLHSAISIGLIGEKSSIDTLTDRLLKEQNADVRYAVLLAISRIGIDSKKSYDALMEAKERETDVYIKDYIEKMEKKFKDS
jgi:HEAT repeat protein